MTTRDPVRVALKECIDALRASVTRNLGRGGWLIGGRTAFFDAYGWNPDIGCDRTLAEVGAEPSRTTRELVNQLRR